MINNNSLKEERLTSARSRYYDTIVIGGGQAGLATGCYLKKQGQDFVILDANERIGDAWRNRWDSLRLFTPARFNGLPGRPFPAETYYFPTKDEMADYLESYAEHFQLPVRTGTRVDRLSRRDDRFVIQAGDLKLQADNVVVAMSNWQKPRVPAFARGIDPEIVQLHSSEYRNPSQLRDGAVLIVGAGNSGAEIAREVAPKYPTWLSGRDTGHLPFEIGGLAYRLFLARLIGRVLFHRVMTVDTPIGRKARAKLLSKGMPLVRVKPKDLDAAGVRRVPRTVGVQDGQPMLEGGRVLEVANVIWSTGFHPGFSWIDLPIFDEGEPQHERGVVASEPGLYFVGLTFLYAASSSMIHGVGRDAEYVVKDIQTRQRRSWQSEGLERLPEREAQHKVPSRAKDIAQP
jgi:putative flavoprotein involved in K+ transport